MDEMELVGRMKDTEPLRPEAFEEARAVLRAAMASSGLVEPEPVRGAPWLSARPNCWACIPTSKWSPT